MIIYDVNGGSVDISKKKNEKNIFNYISNFTYVKHFKTSKISFQGLLRCFYKGRR